MNVSDPWIMNMLFRGPAILLAIGLHEWAHAWTSVQHGDTLPEEQGRLSLNPLDHLDPLGTLCIFFAPIGWGKPVMINPSAYRDPLRDQMRVALAGPMMNLALAAVGSLLFTIAYRNVPYDALWSENLLKVLSTFVGVNIGLAVFNLLPIPPLDGSKVLRAIGPLSWIEFIARIETAGMGMLVILLMIYSGVFNLIFMPVSVLIGALLYGGYTTVAVYSAIVGLAWFIFLRSFPKKFRHK